jgi:hypothetical protein
MDLVVSFFETSKKVACRPSTGALAALFAILSVGPAAIPGPAYAEPIGVTATNETVPTLCAEEDNVYVTLASPTGGEPITRFSVGARHPAYVGTIVSDMSAADYSNCERSNEQFFEFDTRRVTLYEDRSVWLIGYVYERYWLDKDVPVRVGDRVEHGLHMIQLWVQGPRGPEEFLVLYPPDGYWRLRPLMPAHLKGTAYGSSVLFGPIETKTRPIVEIDAVSFDPETRTFDIAFSRGGHAVVTVKQADDAGTVLDVDFGDTPLTGVFAGVRSMYVTPGNADASEVGWRGEAERAWHFEPLPTFTGADDVRELWVGRHIVSRHNTSAPDTVFGDFEGGE